MRRLFPLALGLACGAMMLCCRRCLCRTDRERLRTEIDAFHLRDRDAAMSRDIGTLCELWTEDCVLLAPGRPPIEGRAAVWDYLREQHAVIEDVEILTYEQDFKEVEIAGDWAFEWGIFRGAARPRSGDVIHTRAMLFRILKREADGQWKCARSIWHDDPGDLDRNALFPES